MKKALDLNEYLGHCNLLDSIKLTNNLSFHWANWDKTCNAQREYYKNFNNNYFLIELNESLVELKNKKVWLCNKMKTIESNLYSVYESFLDGRLKSTWFDRKDEILYSEEGLQGPFTALTGMKWLDHQIYSKFILRKILIEQYSLRSFRLNSNIPIQIKFNNYANELKNKAIIHQLTENGIILKITDKNILNRIQHSEFMDLKFSLGNFNMVENLTFENALKKIEEKAMDLNCNVKEFRMESKVLHLYGNSLNVKRSGDDCFYLFARYDDLISNIESLKNVFYPIVLKTKNYLQQGLLEFENNKVWKKTA